MKKPLSLLLTLAMILSLAACGGGGDSTAADTVPSTTAAPAPSSTAAPATTKAPETTEPEPEPEPEYVYKDAVTSLPEAWNPHTAKTADAVYPDSLISQGLYTFIYCDPAHPAEGTEVFSSYAAMPEMAAALPEDVTEEVKAAHPEFGIPEDASEGYAYRIALNPEAKWQDGTAINADTYLDSLQRLLDPKLKNYRASDLYEGSLRLAGAKAYACAGMSETDVNSPDGETLTYQMADLVKGEDGVYTTPEGWVCSFGLDETYAWLGGNALRDYHNFGFIPDKVWSGLEAAADAKGNVPVTDETVKLLYSFISSDDWGGETEEELAYYMSYGITYPETDISSVGLLKTGEYEITLVLERPLTGFYLLNALSRSWLVEPELYDSCLTEKDGKYTSSYGTSPETTASCGPYVLTEYKAGGYMCFERNENWYGWNDGRHVYTAPADGQTYEMYQSTAVDVRVVSSAAEQKELFEKGQLMTYAVQSEDLAGLSEKILTDDAYAEPGSAVWFLVLNGYRDAVEQREAAKDFDTKAYDLQTLTLPLFRRAIGESFDTLIPDEGGPAAVSPAPGLIGSAYLSDPASGTAYRDTDRAKRILCEYYGVVVNSFASLDEAAASINGSDPEAAKAHFKAAFEEALELAYITDEDGDGISDQTVRIEYAAASDSELTDGIISKLNEKTAEAAAGTPFEGRIEFVKSAPYGNEWVNAVRTGKADAVLASWNGSLFDPYALTELYTDPEKQFDAGWFDASAEKLTLPMNGDTLTMSLKKWSDALNGATVKVGDKEYCFGLGAADPETRLDILGALEKAILYTYDYLPVLQEDSVSLLSRQVGYPVTEYDPVLGYGGIRFIRYNYCEADWEAYVASQGGRIEY